MGLRGKEPPIFGVKWRMYDAEPAEGNAVGTAVLTRAGWTAGGVAFRSHRTRERTAEKDADRFYRARGILRDRRLVLSWEAEDRPHTFGAMVLTLDEDCKVMRGVTVLTPQGASEPVTHPIWFRRA